MAYLAIHGARSEKELRAYLYAYAMPMVVHTSYKGTVWAIVEVPDQNAQYQADRFASGMIGATIHSTPLNAAQHLLEALT